MEETAEKLFPCSGKSKGQELCTFFVDYVTKLCKCNTDSNNRDAAKQHM